MKSLGTCEEKPNLSTVVIKKFENDEVDQIDDGKLNNCDNDHDTSNFSLVDQVLSPSVTTLFRLHIGVRIKDFRVANQCSGFSCWLIQGVSQVS
ncbi:unnamed protein product [Trichobilharzia regenti]|nr:unnamed protein product [Trichobilharzia regenti]